MHRDDAHKHVRIQSILYINLKPAGTETMFILLHLWCHLLHFYFYLPAISPHPFRIWTLCTLLCQTETSASARPVLLQALDLVSAVSGMTSLLSTNYLFGSSSVWMLPWHLELNIPEVAFLLLLPRAALPRSVRLKLEMCGFGFFLSCCPYVGRKPLPWCSNYPVFPSYACFCFSSERFSPPFLSTLPRRAPCLQSPPVTVWPANYTRMNLPESQKR